MQFQHRERYPHSSRSSQMSWGIFHNLGLSVQKASKVSKHAKLITSSLCDEYFFFLYFETWAQINVNQNLTDLEKLTAINVSLT